MRLLPTVTVIKRLSNTGCGVAERFLTDKFLSNDTVNWLGGTADVALGPHLVFAIPIP